MLAKPADMPPKFKIRSLIEMNTGKTNMNVKKLSVLALLCALAFGATCLSKLLPPVMFLSYDAKDVIILLGALMYGPLSGLVMALVVSFIEMITISSTGVIGFLMNFISTSAFVCVASLLYKKGKFKHIALPLIFGALAMTGVMLLWNYIVTPYYMGVTRQAVLELMLPLFLPFNLVKSGLNACLAAVLYKVAAPALRKNGFAEDKSTDSEPIAKSNRIFSAILLLFLTATFVLLMLILMKLI